MTSSFDLWTEPDELRPCGHEMNFEDNPAFFDQSKKVFADNTKCIGKKTDKGVCKKGGLDRNELVSARSKSKTKKNISSFDSSMSYVHPTFESDLHENKSSNSEKHSAKPANEQQRPHDSSDFKFDSQNTESRRESEKWSEEREERTVKEQPSSSPFSGLQNMLLSLFGSGSPDKSDGLSGILGGLDMNTILGLLGSRGGTASSQFGDSVTGTKTGGSLLTTFLPLLLNGGLGNLFGKKSATQSTPQYSTQDTINISNYRRVK